MPADRKTQNCAAGKMKSRASGAEEESPRMSYVIASLDMQEVSASLTTPGAAGGHFSSRLQSKEAQQMTPPGSPNHSMLFLTTRKQPASAPPVECEGEALAEQPEMGIEIVTASSKQEESAQTPSAGMSPRETAPKSSPAPARVGVPKSSNQNRPSLVESKGADAALISSTKDFAGTSEDVPDSAMEEESQDEDASRESAATEKNSGRPAAISPIVVDAATPTTSATPARSPEDVDALYRLLNPHLSPRDGQLKREPYEEGAAPSSRDNLVRLYDYRKKRELLHAEAAVLEEKPCFTLEDLRGIWRQMCSDWSNGVNRARQTILVNRSEADAAESGSSSSGSRGHRGKHQHQENGGTPRSRLNVKKTHLPHPEGEQGDERALPSISSASTDSDSGGGNNLGVPTVASFDGDSSNGSCAFSLRNLQNALGRADSGQQLHQNGTGADDMRTSAGGGDGAGGFILSHLSYIATAFMSMTERVQNRVNETLETMDDETRSNLRSGALVVGTAGLVYLTMASSSRGGGSREGRIQMDGRGHRVSRVMLP